MFVFITLTSAGADAGPFNLYSDNISNNISNINTNVEEIKDNINETREEIIEVKHVVTKAITKASALIKYLMKNYPEIPPLKQIDKESIDILRLEYKCPVNDNTLYSLEEKMVFQYIDNVFVENISKVILKIVHYKNPEKQTIYNTDCSRNNYIIKTSAQWNEDKAGIKFAEYVIKPFLLLIKQNITNYRNYLDKLRSTTKMNFIELDVHNKNFEGTIKLEIDLLSEKFVTPIVKRLSPYLRYIEEEIEQFEKIKKIDILQKDLKNIIKTLDDSDNYNDSDDSDDSDNSDDN